MKWYFEVLKKYAVFSGRARRKEYWMFILFNMIFVSVLMILEKVLGIGQSYQIICNSHTLDFFQGYLTLIYSVAVFIPNLAVSIRRMHDIGKSGWMVLISLIPIIGWIWILILFCTKGISGENKYGADPKGLPE